MSDEELRAENQQLRAEVEAYKRRELEQLKAQLADALAAAESYRQQAYQNAENVRQVNAMAEETISRLKSQLEASERMRLTSVRSGIPRAKPSRN